MFGIRAAQIRAKARWLLFFRQITAKARCLLFFRQLTATARCLLVSRQIRATARCLLVCTHAHQRCDLITDKSRTWRPPATAPSDDVFFARYTAVTLESHAGGSPLPPPSSPGVFVEASLHHVFFARYRVTLEPINDICPNRANKLIHAHCRLHSLCYIIYSAVFMLYILDHERV